MFDKSFIDIIIKLSHQYTCFPLKNINFKCVIVISDTMDATTEWPYVLKGGLLGKYLVINPKKEFF